ncbi:hypothetical protein ACHAQH_005537 [Verticillium albo-atrum]
MSEQLSAISDSGASGGSTTPSSFEEATKQPEHLSVSRLDDTKAEVKWPDDTDHDLIERQVAKGTHGGPRMVMAPLGNFRFKGQPLQDCLTCVKLSHWLNDSLFRAYERAMGAFLNERLAAWLTSYPAASPGQKCSSDDVASVFSRLAAKPWYREMPFGVCVDELRSLLEEKHHLLLQDPAWARRVKQVSELGAFMGMDLIEL